MKLIFGALLLDLLLGDPQGFPHPVRWIGWLIAHLDKILNRRQSPRVKLLLGAVMTFIVVSLTFFAARGVIWSATFIHSWVGKAAAVILAYTVLATKSLHQESNKVLKALRENDLEKARRELSYLVSRDTANLDEKEIVRGTLETIAENISDGVIAPLFYLFIGGVPMAMAYKAINTLDSMVGYRNEQYLYFGRAAARLDDVVNYIPARLTAVLIALASIPLGLKPMEALKSALRDGRKHNSPNAGYPEAAAAGALSIQLGGTNYYFNQAVVKPIIGTGTEVLSRNHIFKMIRLLYATALMAVIFFAFIQWLGRFFV